MIALLLFLLLIWIVAGIIGVVVHGLFWLFVIACILFLLTLLGSAFRHGRRSTGRSR